MSRTDRTEVTGALPRPGPVLKGILGGLFGIWLVFALGINWAPTEVARTVAEVFQLLAGSTAGILHGEVWRILTAPLLHSPSGVGQLAFTLLGLYFLSPSLESAWGSRRFAGFVVASGLFAYGFQFVFSLILPSFMAARLVPPFWFGATPVVEAIAIAWALSFRGRTVNLFFVMPVGTRGLILFVVGMSVLNVIAAEQSVSGLLSPFGGMIAGWLVGQNPSPLRRFWLKRQLKQHQGELKRLETIKATRIAGSHLRVIQGGQKDRDSDPPESPRGPDGRLLN